MTDKILVLTNCPTREEAERLARALVEQRLAACVSLQSPQTSIYRWQGAIEQAEEWGLVIKSSRALLPQIQTVFARLHSYQVPELLCLPVIDGSDSYLRWMDAELQSS